MQISILKGEKIVHCLSPCHIAECRKSSGILHEKHLSSIKILQLYMKIRYLDDCKKEISTYYPQRGVGEGENLKE